MAITIIQANAGYREPKNDTDQYLLYWFEDKIQMLSSFQNCADSQGEIKRLKWLLNAGRFFSPRQLPSSFPSGEPQACYKNSQALVLAGEGVHFYVEGIAFQGFQIFPHAWCIDADGNVVDTTWHGRSKQQIVGTAYFGVPISNEDIKRSITTTLHYDQIITPEAVATKAE